MSATKKTLLAVGLSVAGVVVWVRRQLAKGQARAARELGTVHPLRDREREDRAEDEGGPAGA